MTRMAARGGNQETVTRLLAAWRGEVEARAIYDKIVQIAPNDIDARQWLALMHTLASRTGDAVAEKKQIVRILLQQRDFG